MTEERDHAEPCGDTFVAKSGAIGFEAFLSSDCRFGEKHASQEIEPNIRFSTSFTRLSPAWRSPELPRSTTFERGLLGPRARAHRFERGSKTARSDAAPKCYDAGFEAGFSGFNVARGKALVVIPVLVLIDKMFNMGDAARTWCRADRRSSRCLVLIAWWFALEF